MSSDFLNPLYLSAMLVIAYLYQCGFHFKIDPSVEHAYKNVILLILNLGQVYNVRRQQREY